MKSKKISRIAVVAGAICAIQAGLLHESVNGQSAFQPWGARVKVGDECLNYESQCGQHLNSTCRSHYPYGPERRRNIYSGFQGGAYFLIRMFQALISPQDGPNCRFRPVCSAYGRIAVETHGALMGAILTGDRILRCNPFSEPGDDPVPKRIFHDR